MDREATKHLHKPECAREAVFIRPRRVMEAVNTINACVAQRRSSGSESADVQLTERLPIPVLIWENGSDASGRDLWHRADTESR